MVKLRPRARIIRTIGDQLISGPDAAIIELVKNSYDADSSTVKIRIIPRNEGDNEGAILIEDDGHGMSSNDILEKWLEPATTNKIETKTSPKGRRMLGAKGVGRFATSKLGQHLELSSKFTIDDGKLEKTTIVLDWDVFNRSRYLDEIEISMSCTTEESTHPPGTSIHISGLSYSWGERELRSLIKELRRLISPIFYKNNAFQIHLDLSAFTEEKSGFDGQSLVAGKLHQLDGEGVDPTLITPLISMRHAQHYSVSGDFEENGEFSGFFSNNRKSGERTQIKIPASVMQAGESNCGRVKIELSIIDRESSAIDDLIERLNLRGINKFEARRILDENMGIGIYRNGFRIRPYGDPETDWLELERRRVQDPSLRIGHNQVWGMVEIENEEKSRLVERSSREGLEHNGSFLRLKRLATDLLRVVEQDRFAYRESAGISRKKESTTDTVRDRASFPAVEREIKKLPKHFRDRIESALQKDRTKLRTAIEDLESYQQLLASQSALGLVVAQVLHDGRRFLSIINTRAKSLADGAPRAFEDSAFGKLYRENLTSRADSIYESALGLGKLFKALDPISGKKRGRPSDLDVKKIIDRCLDLFADPIQGAEIEVIKDFGEESFISRGYEPDLMAATLNILDNAIYWLARAPAQRIIEIRITGSKKYVRISISNNGPPIEDRFRQRIFNAGTTLKNDGSGIGLAIAREALRASKGDIILAEESELVTFIIEMHRAKDNR